MCLLNEGVTKVTSLQHHPDLIHHRFIVHEIIVVTFSPCHKVGLFGVFSLGLCCP